MTYGSGHGTPALRPLYAEIIQGRTHTRLLDIGAGVGETGRFLRTVCDIDRMDAVEVFDGCVGAMPDGLYDTVWVADAAEFQPEGYDMVLCLDVLEHMPKRDGLQMVGRYVEGGADALVSIPREALRADRNGGAKEGNGREAHVSEWQERDFAAFDTEDYSDGDHVVMLLRGKR